MKRDWLQTFHDSRCNRLTDVEGWYITEAFQWGHRAELLRDLRNIVQGNPVHALVLAPWITRLTYSLEDYSMGNSSRSLVQLVQFVLLADHLKDTSQMEDTIKDTLLTVLPKHVFSYLQFILVMPDS